MKTTSYASPRSFKRALGALFGLVPFLILGLLVLIPQQIQAQTAPIIGYSVANPAIWSTENFTGSSLPIYKTYGTLQNTYLSGSNCQTNPGNPIPSTNCGYYVNYIQLSTTDTVQLICQSYWASNVPYNFNGPKFTGPGTFDASSYGNILYPVPGQPDQPCAFTLGLASAGTPYFYAAYITVLGNGTPTNLVATADKHAEVELSWTDNSSNATGYIVERALQGGVFVTGPTLAANATSYVDSNLPAETTYQYRVRAILAGGTYSDYSNIASVTTLPPLPTPALTVTKVSNSNIALKWSITSSPYWTINSSAEIQGYKIGRKLGANGTWVTIATVTGGQTITYTDTSPVSGNLNYYGVEAYDDTSVSDISGDWLGSYVDITPPSVPVLSLESFFIENTINGAASYIPMVTIKWAESNDDNDNYGDGTFKAFGYNIYRYDSNNNKTTIGTQLTRITIGSSEDFNSYYNDGFEGNNDIASGYALKVGSTYCYAANAYDINTLFAKTNDDSTPQNTSVEGQKQCIKIPNPPGSSAPSVSSVTTVSGNPNTFQISGFNLSPAGNSVMLRPTGSTSLAPLNLWFAIGNSLKEIFMPQKVEAAAPPIAYSSYLINNLSSANGTTLTFSVPATVPDGTYTVSVINSNAIETDTTYTVTVSGNGSGMNTSNPSLALTVSSTTPSSISFAWAHTINLITTASPTVSYSCPVGDTLFPSNTCAVTGPAVTTIPATTVYGCSFGYGIESSSNVASSNHYTITPTDKCYFTAYAPQTKPLQSVGYSCPTGYALSGSMCSSIPTGAAIVPANPSSYSCPFAYSLIYSNICFNGSSGVYTTASTGVYSCPAGYNLSGTSCYTKTTTSATKNYSCQLGFTLDPIHNTCSSQTSVSATSTKYSLLEISPSSGTWTANTSATSYQTTGLNPSTYYCAVVVAVDSPSSQSTSSPVCAVTLSSPSLLPSAPTATISATPISIPYNGGATLNWSSTNASSCTASGAWSGSQAISGSYTSGPLTATSTFSISCSGVGGSSPTQSVTVGVSQLPPPLLIPATIVASAGAGGFISPSGAVTVKAPQSSQTFTITPASGYQIASVTVDGVNVGTVSSYAFQNVAGTHTINVAFSMIKSSNDYRIIQPIIPKQSSNNYAPVQSILMNQPSSSTANVWSAVLGWLENLFK